MFSSMEVHISSISRVRQPNDQNLGFYQKGQQRILGLTAIIIDNGDGTGDDSNNTINRCQFTLETVAIAMSLVG